MLGRKDFVATGTVIVVLLLAVVLGLWLSPTRDVPVNAVMFDISPEQGIGPIEFGATADDIEAMFGAATKWSPNRDAMIYRDYGLVFYLDRDGRLARFEAVSASANLSIRRDFAGTVQGRIRIGSSAPDVIQCLGEPTSAETWDEGKIAKASWDHLGLTMHFDDDNGLGSISVQAGTR